MKNIVTGVIFGIIIAMWFVYFYRQDKLPFIKKPVAIALPTPTATVTLFPSATLAPSSAPYDENADLLAIKQLFANKYHRSVSDVVLTEKNYDGDHFLGTVSFKLAMAGGVLLAARDVQDNWNLVQDGNGSIMCDNIKPYNFPVSMVSECVIKSGKLIELQ